LNRYDGNRFKVYRNQASNEHSLPFNNLRALHYDARRDWLWVGTTKGLCRYRKDQDDFLRYDLTSGLKELFIRFINQDRAGNIWVATDRGLYFYQADTDTFVSLKHLPDRVVRAVVQDDNGQIFIGTSVGIFRLAPQEAMENTRFHKVDPGGKGISLFVQDLLLSPTNELWIATRDSGLFRWNITTDQLKQFPAGAEEGRLSHQNVRALAMTEDGALWAGTFVGLNRLPSGAERFDRFFEAPQAFDGLKSHSVHSLFADRRGNVWAGTYYGGVSYHHPLMDRINYYSRREGQLNNEVVSAFEEDSRRNLWIGTEGGGLNYFDRTTERFTSYAAEAGLPGKNVKCLLLNGDDLWVGMYQYGISRLDVTTKKVVPDLGFYPDSAVQQLINVYDIHLKHDTLWLALYGQGLAQVALATGEVTLIQ
ncbi:MAG: two-component regulator propeller domain-containing protein, partial [Bacteroidota bacterium]